MLYVLDFESLYCLVVGGRLSITNIVLTHFFLLPLPIVIVIVILYHLDKLIYNYILVSL